MIPSDLFTEVGAAIDAVSARLILELFPEEETICSIHRNAVLEVIEQSFAEGFRWTADAIHEKTAGGTSVTYPRALEMLSDLDSWDDWVYAVSRLEHHEGVRLIAQLYGVPVVMVARELADLRSQIKEHLAERWHE